MSRHLYNNYDVPPHPDLILHWEINTEWTEILKTSNKGLQGIQVVLMHDLNPIIPHIFNHV